MSGITRPVGHANVRRAPGALTQVGLVLVAALITAAVVLVTSSLVDRWS